MPIRTAPTARNASAGRGAPLRIRAPATAGRSIATAREASDPSGRYWVVAKVIGAAALVFPAASRAVTV
jgi:hypothetical protein